MPIVHGVTRSLLACTSLALLLSIAMPAQASDEEPWLAIHLTAGGSAEYPVSSIEQVLFDEDAVIVVTGTGTDSYPAEEIAKIEFLWDPANSFTPEGFVQALKAVRLFQNQPNPFSPETLIAFDLPHAGPVSLRIYHANGRLIRTVVNEARDAGRHSVRWDGLDDSGVKVAAGVYFCRLRSAGVEESRRMVLLP